MFRKNDRADAPSVSPEQQRRIEFKSLRRSGWDKLLEEARLRDHGQTLCYYSQIIADVLDDCYSAPLGDQRRALKKACPLDDWSMKHDFCGELWRREVSRQRKIRSRQDREWRLGGRVGECPSTRRKRRLPFPEPTLEQEDPG